MLATWNGDYPAATRRYRQLQALQPADTTIALDLAASVRGREKRRTLLTPIDGLEAHPDAADVWLDLATAESWRGRYASALAALDGNAQSLRRIASLLARSCRESLLAQDVQLAQWMFSSRSGSKTPAAIVNLARAIAFTMRRSIADTRRTYVHAASRSDEPRERNAERLARAMLGSSVEPGFTFYSDSDNLQVAQLHPLARSCLRAALGCRRDTQDTSSGNVGQRSRPCCRWHRDSRTDLGRARASARWTDSVRPRRFGHL